MYQWVCPFRLQRRCHPARSLPGRCHAAEAPTGRPLFAVRAITEAGPASGCSTCATQGSGPMPAVTATGK